LEKKYSVGRAAHRLKLKLSTAKMIIKKFKESGAFFEKKFDKKRNKETSIKRSERSE
jgi:DNA-binding MarR family transcriptional regulator